MTPDKRASRLRDLLATGPLRKLVIGYIAAAWGVLELVMTVSELAGWSLAVPRWLLLILASGLAVMLVAAATLRSAKALRAASPDKGARRREVLGLVATIFALLPMSLHFRLSDGSVEWIMWRDSPIWAAICGATALLLGAVWVLSKPSASSSPDQENAVGVG